ncbi:MAG: isoaspartyl peptidase/L-asparaginase [Gammaproteobacteria bacterium]|nr:isoaspartyl peptidase/L-asparaginase [Gammaproteobacteria bacterium]
MRRLAVICMALVACTGVESESTMKTEQPYGLVVHGGAGTLTRSQLSPEYEQQIRAAMAASLAAGHEILAAGGSSTEATIAAVVVLEESPLFNAGKGSVYTWEETHELDASLMVGSDQRAGAVASVRNVRNPIRLAQLVMDDSPHVMLAGEGADQFAREKGVELVDNDWFDTDFRLQQLHQAKQEDNLQGMLNPLGVEKKFGTVGAVAVDMDGELAAATSTGGTTAKRWGRVGDSPIIGAGTYANSGCAVSATGHGEYFIRHAVAHDICARHAYLDVSIKEAADMVVMDVLVRAGGEGGVIAIDRDANVALPFNTEGMYRGYQVGDNDPVVGIFGDE